MPSKLRKAIGAVKDQTSISFAKVTNAANLEVTILKATTHDEVPIEERYVKEILQFVSSNKVFAAACAQAIGKRIGKTRNWVVALKSLMLVLRIFQDGDPYFPREVFHAMKRGAKILNLSNFRDDSNSSPWDYTAFVRTFALYLDERLDCFLTGKLQRRFTYHDQISSSNGSSSRNNNNHSQGRKPMNDPGIRDLKPGIMLDKISYWQKLLDRAIGTTPTGAAMTNRLVQICTYAVVQESFDLYRDISDGLVVILDSFFDLPYQSCVAAFQACVKSTKQFDELSCFHKVCQSIGVGRTSEYPSIQKISEELLETLQEFLKDQASFPSQNGRSPLAKHILLPHPSLGNNNNSNSSNNVDRFSERGSEYGSLCTSLEDLMTATDAGTTSPRSNEQETYSVQSEPYDKQSLFEDFNSCIDSGSTHSLPRGSCLDLVCLDDWQQEDEEERKQNPEKQEKRNSASNFIDGSRNCWELLLVETTTKQENISLEPSKEFNPSADNLFNHSPVPQGHYNPFLHDIIEPVPTSTTSTSTTTISDLFVDPPTFSSKTSSESAHIMPTFSAQNSDEKNQALDLFANMSPRTTMSHPFQEGSTKTPNLFPNNSNNVTPPTFCVQNANDTPTSSSITHFSPRSNELTIVAPSFQARNLDDTTMSPRVQYDNSSRINMSPTFRAHNFGDTTTSPTFFSQRSTDTNVAPTFSAQVLNDTSTTSFPQNLDAKTFQAQSTSSEVNLSPSYRAHNFNDTSIAPNFRAQNSPSSSTFRALNFTETSTISPTTFFAQSSTNTTFTAPTFHAQNFNEVVTAPTFEVRGFPTMITAPTFQAQSSLDSNIRSNRFGQSLIEEANATPTFCAQSSIETTGTQKHGAQNAIVLFKGSPSAASPTFFASNSSDISAVALDEDDPFGSTSNGSMNDQNLLKQQQMWLENQSKIIAKHMGGCV